MRAFRPFPWLVLPPYLGFAVRRDRTDVVPLFRFVVRIVRTGDLFKILWERISRTTQTTLPNRLRAGPKLPSQVISDLGPENKYILRYLTGLIRSRKTIKVASSNSAHRESSQRQVLRGNTNRGNGLKPAWGYACQGEPCSARRLCLLGRAMLGQTVVAAMIYGFVRTDQTSKLSKHIYAPDLGLKLPSQVISDRTEAYLAKWSKLYDLSVPTIYVQ